MHKQQSHRRSAKKSKQHTRSKSPHNTHNTSTRLHSSLVSENLTTTTSSTNSKIPSTQITKSQNSSISTSLPLKTASSTSFRQTTPQNKFTRIIDASLSLKNHHAKNRAAENIKKIKQALNDDRNLDNLENPQFEEFLDDSRAKAQRHKSRIERKMRSKDTQHPFSAYNFNITVIGRPNVGKSSLFNRLTGETISMVHNSSGVTRDWNHSSASLANLDFQVIDTAGLEEAIVANQSNPNRENDVAFGPAVAAEVRSGSSPLVTHKNKKGKVRLNIPKTERTSNYILGRPLTKDLQESMLQLTSGAIKSADIVIFMIDAKQGVTQQDEFFSHWIRKQLHTSSQLMQSDVNISNFNKYYTLLAQELKDDVDGVYKNDPTKLPLEKLQKLAHIEDIDTILNGSHTDRQFLRSIHTKPVIVLANKYDYGNLHNAKALNDRLGTTKTPDEVLIQDFDLLGFDDVVPFSAIHGIGLGELYSKLVFSMSKVLKQWDVYQKKVKFIQKVHQEVEFALKQKQIDQNTQRRIENKIKHQEGYQKHLDKIKLAEFEMKSGDLDGDFEGQIESKKNKKVLFDQENDQNGSENGSENDYSDDFDAKLLRNDAEYANSSQLRKKRNQNDQHSEESYESDAQDEELYQQYRDAEALEAQNDHKVLQTVDIGEETAQNGQNGEKDQNDLDIVQKGHEILPEIDGTSLNEGKDKAHQVKFVVTGRPNAGKSTLLNALLGQKRLLTGPQPGITRDSIKLDYNDPKYPNHHFQLVDTAGLKGITQHQHSRFDLVDSAAMQSSLKSIQNANVVALVVDVATGLYGNQGIDPVFTAQIQKNFIDNVQQSRFDSAYEQAKAKGASDEHLALLKRKHVADKSAYDDKLTMLVSRVAGCVTKHELDIARVVADHGKALLVIANKIDRLKGGQEEVQAVMKGLLALFSMTYAQNKGVTILPVSALQSTNTNQIIRKVAQLYDRWDSRIGTGVLNRWLAALTQLSPPPKVGTHSLSLKYITQTNTRPPTFALFVNRKTDFPLSYERFVRNSLINEFNLQGIPVRLHLRSGKNPYVSSETLTSSERFQIGKRRQRDEITRIKQARSGKNNRAVHAGKAVTKGFKAGTASLRSDPQHLERQLDKQFGKGDFVEFRRDGDV